MARSLSRLRRTAKRLALAVIVGSVCFSSAAAQESNVLTWLDNNGAKLEAVFLRLDGDTVVLAKRDKTEIKVPLEKLSLMSQYQAKKAADPRAFEKPAPPPPPPKMEMDKVGDSPFPDSPTPEQTVQIILDNLKQKKPGVLWHAMPASMQKDVSGLMSKGMEMAGPKVLKQVQSIMQNLLVIVRDKQNMIVKSRALAQQPEVVAALKRELPRAVPALETLASSNTWSPSNFTEESIGDWLVTVLNDSGEMLVHIDTKPVHISGTGAANPYGMNSAGMNPYGNNSGDMAGNFQNSGAGSAGLTNSGAESSGGMLNSGGMPNSGGSVNSGGASSGGGQPEPPKAPPKVADEVDISQIKFKVVKSDANTAEIEFSIPGRPATIESFTKVENRWLPSSLVNDWNSQVAKLRSAMDSVQPEDLNKARSTIAFQLTTFNVMLGPLAGARSQEEVDSVLASLLALLPAGPAPSNGMAGGGLMSGSSTPPNPNGAPPNPSGGFPGRSASSSQ